MNNNKLKKAYEFLKLAYKELEEYEKTKKGVILQEACEKGWAAVVQALKVVNPDIKRHADFGRTARKLAEEYNDKEIFDGEAIGEYLHRTGFYEGLIEIEEAKYGLFRIENFLKLIDNILKWKGKTKYGVR